MTDETIQQLAHAIEQSENIIVFTGAGISTESGIADYRSKGGLWDRFQPVTIQEFVSDQQKRIQYWQQKLELLENFKTAQPNAGHQAIVQLEQQGKLKALITQNIDGLHQMAGTSPEKILELHGTNRETICLSCQWLEPWTVVYERLQKGEEVPLCKKCGGLLKPNTISFGQSLNQELLHRAFALTSQCDMMLAIGSTLIVEPAASLPRMAKEQGAKLCIITLSETPLDSISDLKIPQSAAKVLTKAIIKN